MLYFFVIRSQPQGEAMGEKTITTVTMENYPYMSSDIPPTISAFLYLSKFPGSFFFLIFHAYFGAVSRKDEAGEVYTLRIYHSKIRISFYIFYSMWNIRNKS